MMHTVFYMKITRACYKFIITALTVLFYYYMI